jgi:hypothetical protein
MEPFHPAMNLINQLKKVTIGELTDNTPILDLLLSIPHILIERNDVGTTLISHMRHKIVFVMMSLHILPTPRKHTRFSLVTRDRRRDRQASLENKVLMAHLPIRNI